MRLVLVNPHVNYCGKMVFNWIFRFPHHHKYNFLWREYVHQDKDKIVFFVDGTQSSFYQTQYFKKTIGRSQFLVKLFSIIEFWIWCRINNLPRGRYHVVYSLKKLNPKSDILFCFGFTSTKSQFHNYTGLVLMHLTHYHHDSDSISRWFQTLQHGFIVADSDLRTSDYFHRFFPDIPKAYHLPLTITSDRFQNSTPFSQRINKCFASGSMSVPTAPAYVQFYGQGAALNPMREVVHQKRETVNDVMEVYIFPHNDALKAMKQITPTDTIWRRWAKMHLPAWLLKLLFRYKLPFFSFDIVKKYNEYTMFMSPEERTGLPSMKLLEGMLCGSVLVGIDDPMYTNIGFQDGVNCILYREMDLAGLVEKLRWYQAHPDELAAIAKKGYEFARTNFSPARVANTFWHDLERLQAGFLNGTPHFESSFVQAHPSLS